MKQTLHWRQVRPIFVSQCCANRVSLTVTKHLDFFARSIRPMWLQGLYLRTLFLGSKCWMLPRHIYPMGNLGPKETWMLAGGVRLDALFNTNMKSAVSSKFLNFFIYTALFNEAMFVDISLECVVSQRPLCGTLVRLPWTLSLIFPIHEGWRQW